MGVLLLIALCIVGLVFGVMTLIFPHPLVPTFISAKPKKPKQD